MVLAAVQRGAVSLLGPWGPLGYLQDLQGDLVGSLAWTCGVEVAQEGPLYSNRSCGYQEEAVEATEDLQQTSEGDDEVEVPVDALQSRHHHPGLSAVYEPAVCPSDVSS